jgi:predicted transcriptional regulator of viral defense system
VDDKQLATQRAKTIKTGEALMRAFDDLQTMKAKSHHEATIDDCKALIKIAKEWK